MNSSNASPYSVLFDTTVLCGAIRTDGINRKLLRLAGENLNFTPVLSRVCLMEFYKKAIYDGIAGTVYPEPIVEQFLDHFVYPVLENHPVVNSKVGRYHWEIIKRTEMKIGQALAEISGCTTEEAFYFAEQLGLQNPLNSYDQQDVHVWVTAIQEKCKFIVSSNSRRFPETIGYITRIKPGEFYNLIMEE
ncbi:PIN domain-containing protein [Paenibacillus agaridevorans]|uniref:PIN domain-containing protein n=1 Tax=Paenibacillus agaridevorans TaxID=171404 RepID=UPI001BE47AE0|nr:PIN domain-containing protein [Paenibacillus agaridevorans]